MKTKERMSVLFIFGRQIFRIIFSIFYRWHIEGIENIPQSGGAIIAPNHSSFFDPPLTGAAMKRPLYFMAKKELFDIPIFGWIIRQTNAFPVNRSFHDMRAIKHAFSLLRRGHLLLIFPEGTRSRDVKIGKARAGAGMIAYNAQVPLIPVKIENAGIMLSKFKQIKIKFGIPIYPSKNFVKSDYINLSQQVLNIVSKM
jgi:1-acyl-sn-glycerol-3-phosphate acyltransferase